MPSRLIATTFYLHLFHFQSDIDVLKRRLPAVVAIRRKSDNHSRRCTGGFAIPTCWMGRARRATVLFYPDGRTKCHITFHSLEDYMHVIM